MPSIHRLLASAILIAILAPSPAIPQLLQDNDDDQASYSAIVITGSRVRQGGAQDIKHFRAMADMDGLPRPEGMSVEGLMGEYDLTLPVANSQCRQAFCLIAETMPAALPTRSDDLFFTGIGFASNIDEKHWHRAPLNLVAVVDKSGSMSGMPLTLVRESLRHIVNQMESRDQISIILYGDTSAVYLQPTQIGSGREEALAAIDGISSNGSTDMESGLKVGYKTAFESAPAFKGKTRVMLFTDEQPNVGRTDADSFITMAETASRQGIGLTTIGVGTQFGDALAGKISSVRGGNLFFIADATDVQKTFEKHLDTMVSELAHDLRITMRPAPGYKLSGVFGVPGNTMTETPDGETVITVPTVFLSTNGGGIFVTLAKSSDRSNLPVAPLAGNQSLLALSLNYSMADDGSTQADHLQIAQPTPDTPASAPLRRASLLVDEYLSLKGAATAFHTQGDPKQAYALIKAFTDRLEGAGFKDMKQEQTLATQMLGKAAYFAGYAGEGARPVQHLAMIGRWQVIDQRGLEDPRRGDVLQFTPTHDLLTFHKGQSSTNADDTEYFQVNEKEIFLTHSNLIFSYSVKGDRMNLWQWDGREQYGMTLQRIASTD